MRRDELRIDCPSCGKRVVQSSREPAPFFPFCCERCKLIDLGRWFDEEHRIEGSTEPDDRAEPEPPE